MRYSTVTNGYHRVFVKVGGVNNSWSTWTPSGVVEGVANALDQAGIGYESIHNNQAISFNPFYFEFTVTVIAVNGQSNELVKQLVAIAVSSVLNEVQTSILSSESENDWSIGNAINAAGDVISSGSTAATLGIASTGTIILLAVSIAAIFLLKPSIPFRRY